MINVCTTAVTLLFFLFSCRFTSSPLVLPPPPSYIIIIHVFVWLQFSFLNISLVLVSHSFVSTWNLCLLFSCSVCCLHLYSLFLPMLFSNFLRYFLLHPSVILKLKSMRGNLSFDHKRQSIPPHYM